MDGPSIPERSRINPKPSLAARFNEKGCLPVWGWRWT